ncbi:hypothetical protein L486_00742 [Kwoniella mangroviensis CBS 10435]|uniref:Uncharacterized protein n=1 Tax=Kwoniella mangroviensis CBS 10435 TaxID=1331196 RepID=A0A1B9IZZ1_9TREE|nr:uncharacterized protein I203_04274 [Kwoniella mangroviensis CBS 8507]OCF61098.1 hypothetical protein L486_00742 [Kwoniella mangroviensis CBS 10435]OCF66698.1 hypothetical protein I203_04274 [Kwoniella mangroviensis CBS 8507]OCF74154.1 hypothetical protein I204_04524 [Kwoniella mangroviensis CBS 8886]
MPPKRITRSQAQASQASPASEESVTTISRHARHSRATDVDPNRTVKGGTPQPEVQALSSTARAPEARAVIRDCQKSTAASRR